jgi:hypothetical protein
MNQQQPLVPELNDEDLHEILDNLSDRTLLEISKCEDHQCPHIMIVINVMLRGEKSLLSAYGVIKLDRFRDLAVKSIATGNMDKLIVAARARITPSP